MNAREDCCPDYDDHGPQKRPASVRQIEAGQKQIEADTPMARIMGRWPGDETDAEIKKGLADLQRKDLEGRLPIVYNGKTAEEWYTLYCQEVLRNSGVTNEIVAKKEWTDEDQAIAESWDDQRDAIARKILEDRKVPSRQLGK